VLEFLIAQQDWFMLDIPPPPQNEPNSPESWDDVMVADDEHSPVGGAWNLVGSNAPTMVRRKTTVGRYLFVSFAANQSDRTLHHLQIRQKAGGAQKGIFLR
jgi:hypothetical protein